MIIEVLQDTIIDCLKLIPFLFIAFVLIEAIEHYSSDSMRHALKNFEKAGPVIGALCGCIPQCGFSVLAANLYAGGVITPGTLISVFLSTSDEAIIIILGNPGYLKEIGSLVLIKLAVAIAAGYITDILLARFIVVPKNESELCDHCGCHEHKSGLIGPAITHTLEILAYLFVCVFVLNIIVECIGAENFSSILLGNTIFQPMIAAIIGFIPNCAASVILTQLYLNGIISFASVIAGLCTGAGAGLLVFVRVNKHKKETVKIIGLLYAYSVIAGIIIELIVK